MLLVREHMDLPMTVWNKYYLTYKDQIVGICAPSSQVDMLRKANHWFAVEARPIRAYAAAISTRLFSRKATALSAHDILSLPYPESGTLDLSANEQILVDDIVDQYRSLIRIGQDSPAMSDTAAAALEPFNETFTSQINAIYRRKPLRVLPAQTWPGVICQPYIFGKGTVDWSGAKELKGKLDGLLHEQKKPSLHITRVARIKDGHAIYLLKPDRLRYWLRSIALRDSDETLADLAEQGF